MTDRAGPPDDSWGQARLRARADVAAALAPVRRTCPDCGAGQDADAGRRCTRCGADLVARRSRQRPGRRRLAGLGAGATLLTLLVLAVVLQWRDGAEREERAADRRQAAVESAERGRLRREGRPRSAPLPPLRRGDLASARRRAVRATERLITADAVARVRAGSMDGPVTGTSCSPDPPTATRMALENRAHATRRSYGCVAIESRFDVPAGDGEARTGLIGNPYRAVIDDRRRVVTWCRVFPPAGEGARSLAVVALDPACRASVATPARR